jgi:hypothetical protein
MTDMPSTQATDGVPTYLGTGDPYAEHFLAGEV